MSPVRFLLLRRTIIDNSSESWPDWGQLWGQLMTTYDGVYLESAIYSHDVVDVPLPTSRAYRQH